MVYFVVFGMVFFVSVALRLASALGLTVPLAYGLIAPTLFYDWFHANQALAEGIGWLLLGLAALHWLLSLICRIVRFIRQRQEDRAAVELFVYRLRQAQAQGMDTVSTEGLWR